MEFKAKTRKWGSSIGIVLPKELIEEAGIKPHETITVSVKTWPKAREFFGMLKGWKKSAQELKDEARKGWD